MRFDRAPGARPGPASLDLARAGQRYSATKAGGHVIHLDRLLLIVGMLLQFLVQECP